jgi:hypothetical protein
MRAFIAGLLASLLALPAFAQDGETDAAAAADDFNREPVECLTASRIERTQVIDERTILFYMRGGDIYRNQLSVNCRPLLREKSFSYELRTSRLCDIDFITVIEHMGSTLREGVSCGLGKFYPVTEEEAIFLSSDADARLGAGQAVTTPEEEDEEEDEDEDSAAAERSETPVDPPADR